jgi:hypothetical protein
VIIWPLPAIKDTQLPLENQEQLFNVAVLFAQNIDDLRHRSCLPQTADGQDGCDAFGLRRQNQKHALPNSGAKLCDKSKSVIDR